jgi:hypothetical protein
MLVYGWNSFKLNSYEPTQLGIPTHPSDQFTIEHRQAYFHLFWIPFFSLGKRWVIRKDGKMYVMADAFKPIVEQIPNKKGTPWYTFTGLLLGLAAIIFFSI